jgi:hypothetical protein
METCKIERVAQMYPAGQDGWRQLLNISYGVSRIRERAGGVNLMR